jgi:hypothetical protein
MVVKKREERDGVGAMHGWLGRRATHQNVAGKSCASPSTSLFNNQS